MTVKCRFAICDGRRVTCTHTPAIAEFGKHPHISTCEHCPHRQEGRAKVVPKKAGRTLTPEQIGLAQVRATICTLCPHVAKDKQGKPAVRTDPMWTVSCTRCGCGGVPLEDKADRCPDGKWTSDHIAQSRKLVEPVTFDRCVAINLSRRADRWESLQATLAALPWPLCSVERFDAIDGKKIKPPTWWNAGPGAWGVYLSHLRIIEDTLRSGGQSVLILEDDPVFIEGFNEKLGKYLASLPGDAHHIYMGGQHLKLGEHPPQPVNEHVVRAFNVNRCHAHALRGDYLTAAYHHLLDLPALKEQHERSRREEKVKAWHVDHWFGELHQTGRWNVYAPTTWLVGQQAGKSDICEKSLPPRFWQVGGLTRDQKQRRRFLVTGHPRSGTKYMAKLLQSLGLDVRHESMGADGISSWMFAVDADKVPYTGDGTTLRQFSFQHTILAVRHPLDVLASSMQTEAEPSLKFRRRWSRVPVGYNRHEEAVHILLAWHDHILKLSPSIVVQVERAAEVIPAAFDMRPVSEPPSVTINHRTHEPLTWTDLQQYLRESLRTQLAEYAYRCGYDLERSHAMSTSQQH
jgi:GR25 family glycosyltransferase involved in LPS biosynthesis